MTESNIQTYMDAIIPIRIKVKLVLNNNIFANCKYCFKSCKGTFYSAVQYCIGGEWRWSLEKLKEDEYQELYKFY